MTLLEISEFIATVAHTANGQYRADKVTRYIEHPRRVVELIREWYDRPLDIWFGRDGRWIAEAFRTALDAAWLHDVVEDTCVTFADLRAWGVDPRTVEVVDLLTKENATNEAESAVYYQRIASDDVAMLVKAADRCGNLEDAANDILAGAKLGDVRRWNRYAQRTKSDVLPIYASLPALRSEIKNRVQAVEHAILQARGVDLNGVFDCGVAVK